MNERTLFIHAGGSKTGSSALQNFFEINALKLQEQGYAYQNRLNIKTGYEINSGNGVLLYKELSSSATTSDQIDRLVLSYFGSSVNAICSCENFAELTAHNWKILLESSIRIGVKLKVIFYVRNVIPYFLSGYDQVIKRHGVWQLFDEWVLRAIWQHIRTLHILADELPKSSIQVVHFDKVKESLIRSFVDVLGVDPSFVVDPNDQSRQVNRSLTEEERKVLLMVNRILGSVYSQELSDLLIYTNPDVPGEPIKHDGSITELLFNRFKKDVDWVNDTFFNGQPIVSVFANESEKKAIFKKQLIKLEKNCSVEDQVFDWVLEKLKTAKKDSEQLMQQKINVLINAAKQHSGNFCRELPVDFDSLNYLLLNPDVFYAGADPIQHFIVYGRAEGRAYKLVKNKKSWFHGSNKFLNRLFNHLIAVPFLITDLLNKILSKTKLIPYARISDLEKTRLDLALDRLKKIIAVEQDLLLSRILFTLSVAKQNQQGKLLSGVPFDFDPLAYLLLNPDVVYADADPIKHYIKYGSKEGRVYRF